MSNLTCPFCHQSNLCTSLQGNIPCWCFNEQGPFPQELLDLLAEHEKNTSCICKKCLDQFRQTGKIIRS